MLSDQYTQNCYLGQGRVGESQWCSYDFPGCKAFLSATGADRGMVEYLGETYKVSGTTLYSINSAGTATSRGAVPGAGRCIFAIAYDEAITGYGLCIVTDGIPYYYDQSNVTVMSDADLIQPINSVTMLNDVLIFDRPDGEIVASEGGIPTTISAYYASTNTKPDGIQRLYTFGQLIYVFGSQSVEPWYYNGSTTGFIFSRQEQGVITVGLGARHSLASDESYMYFLGHDRRVYRLRGALAEPISMGQSDELESLTTYDDAIGWCLKIDGQGFYWLTFPTAGKSLLYSTTYNYWTHLAYGTDSDNPERHLANSHIYINGKNYVADYNNGNVYELDKATFTDNSAARLRIRVMSPLTGEQLGLLGRRITVGRLQLQAQIGVGLATGQGVDPLLMIQASGDGGKTWGNIQHVSIGELGDYVQIVKFDQFVNGRSIVYRIMCSDPVYMSIFGGMADVSDGGY